jgi:hypothetical protein
MTGTPLPAPEGEQDTVIDENSRLRESVRLTQQQNEGLRQELDALRQEVRAESKAFQQAQS